MKVNKEIVDDRRKKIMQEIQAKGSVRVDELVRKFNVTPLTIRRDLQYWEDLGAIIRYYGGAKLVQSFVVDDKLNNEPYKHAIAKYAASLVEEGDTIFLNTSSTALLILDYLVGKTVNVVTNNGKAIFKEHDPNVRIILTGGELRTPKESMVGEFALYNVSRVSANKCFIGCSGFDHIKGMTTAILPEVSINEAMIEHSDQAFILADSTKINNVHQFFVAPVKAFDYLITDIRCSDEELMKFDLNKIRFHKLEPLYSYTK